MSPINSNSSERDFEAIHRAQRAHEPSMEEILASIRNIIADDPAKRPAPKAPQPAPTPAPRRRSSIPKTPRRRTARLPDRPSARTRTRRRSFGAGPKRLKPSPPPRLSRAKSRCCRLKRPRRRPCRSGPCPPASMCAAPNSPTAWCATCCGRCSSPGWTTTFRPLSSGWSGMKFRGSRAGENRRRRRRPTR